MNFSKYSERLLLKAQSAADKVRSEIIDEMIAEGRGYEKHNETFLKSDPLAVRFKLNSNECCAITAEIRRRSEYHGTLKPIRQND